MCIRDRSVLVRKSHVIFLSPAPISLTGASTIYKQYNSQSIIHDHTSVECSTSILELAPYQAGVHLCQLRCKWHSAQCLFVCDNNRQAFQWDMIDVPHGYTPRVSNTKQSKLWRRSQVSSVGLGFFNYSIPFIGIGKRGFSSIQTFINHNTVKHDESYKLFLVL